MLWPRKTMDRPDARDWEGATGMPAVLSDMRAVASPLPRQLREGGGLNASHHRAPAIL